MSFTIDFAEGIKPSVRSDLSNGLHFSLHDKSKYILPKEASEGENKRSIQNRPVETPILTINQYLYGGHLWDFWLAHHPHYGKVVLKVINTFNHPCWDPNLDDYVPYKDIIKEATREESFYLGPLKELQETVVPKYFGLYSSGKTDRYLAILLEYGGQSIGAGYVELHKDWKKKIYEAYKQIHLKGVCHFDLGGQHILVNDHQEIRLVSFRRSNKLDVKKRQDVLRILEEVYALRLRYGGKSEKKLKYNTLSPDYWSQLPDPQAFKEHLDECANRVVRLPPEVVAYN
ncbi:hypothetical protein V865_005915 [Kwoniella europaea PYCC6329]|uniref:Protein kinase domain-containing protein n=1 Tax=Kwoniella europaea PYCC6329 TaxID=1423913 RepID=A0AAX4KMT8_9TREE